MGAFSHVTEGDVLYKRGLFADALKRYTQCVDTAGAFEGGWYIGFLRDFALYKLRSWGVCRDFPAVDLLGFVLVGSVSFSLPWGIVRAPHQ